MHGDEPDFDEEWYLRSYPDVAAAVAAGLVGSGRHHYLAHGRAEGRRPRPGAGPGTATRAPVQPANTAAAALKPLHWPPIEVELSASDQQIEALLLRVKRNFEFMGEREPHWSVLSAERYLAHNIASTEAEFFESGKTPVQELAATAARCGVRLGHDMTCFELGCGIGRSTIWLAETFGRVIGSDISAPHLRLAAAAARRFGRNNIGLVQIDRPEPIADLPPFDVFFSMIVLQHNPPPVIVRYLSAILRRLRPGGIAYFQVPTYRAGYEFAIAGYLAGETRLGMPEMHVVPQPTLFALFEEAGCRPVEVREDSAAGDNHISHRFLIRKAA